MLAPHLKRGKRNFTPFIRDTGRMDHALSLKVTDHRRRRYLGEPTLSVQPHCFAPAAVADE